jgi:hypothetical protein
MNTSHTNGATRSTLVKITPAKRTQQPSEVEIENIETLTVPVTIVGKSQLIVNNFGAKGAQQLEDQRALTKEEREQQRKNGKKEISPAEIERRFQAARCLNSKGEDCVRAAWLKGALVSAGKYPDIGIASTRLKGVLYVEGDLLPIKFKTKPKSESDETITYYGKGPAQRRDVVRVGLPGRKQPDIRYRPAYDDWSVDFHITFEPRFISQALVYHLVRAAGTRVGLCEWRPEGPGGGDGGTFGRFDIKMDAKVRS